jgi:hypothetical protein
MQTLGSRLIAAAASTLALAIVTPLLADEPAAPPPHIRPLSADARELVTSGVTRSELIRELIARLEASDVVVYVDYGWLIAGRSGQLAFVSSAGGSRYVMIQIASGLIEAEQLATLGHELRHAVEIADATEVIGGASFARHYSDIGIDLGLGVNRRYETEAAVEAGRSVRRELSGAVASARADR